MEKEIARDFFTHQLLTKASPAPVVKADFTAQILAQIEADAIARKAKILEPLIPARVWWWIGIILCSMVLFVLSLSVLAFGSWPNVRLTNPFTSILKNAFSYNQLNYWPELFLAGLICFCWLVLDYGYERLRNS